MIKLFHWITRHRWDKKLITEILNDPRNARGFYKWNPQYFYNGYWYVLNLPCNRILKYKKIWQ